MQRKWTMGRAPAPQPTLGRPPAASTSDPEVKAGEEPLDSEDSGDDSVVGYLGRVDRIPSATHIGPVPDPFAAESSSESQASEAELQAQELANSPSRVVTEESRMTSAERLFGEDFRPDVAAKEPSLFSTYVVIQTLWHPKSERRTARITVPGGTQLQLQEGDRVGELTIEAIELSGVVFLHEGVEVRRGVGQRG
ncbi:MAG: hypothetical protein P8Q97_11015 [Myxococcota bacterium]|nr:hypothetical protein [Myxococcota bacterium]